MKEDHSSQDHIVLAGIWATIFIFPVVTWRSNSWQKSMKSAWVILPVPKVYDILYVVIR